MSHSPPDAAGLVGVVHAAADDLAGALPELGLALLLAGQTPDVLVRLKVGLEVAQVQVLLHVAHRFPVERALGDGVLGPVDDGHLGAIGGRIWGRDFSCCKNLFW